MLGFYYSFNEKNRQPGALIVDNAEERFNYRNKERAGGGVEELEERFRARNDGKILSHHRYEDTIY